MRRTQSGMKEKNLLQKQTKFVKLPELGALNEQIAFGFSGSFQTSEKGKTYMKKFHDTVWNPE